MIEPITSDIKLVLVDEENLSRIATRNVLQQDAEIQIIGEYKFGTDALPQIIQNSPDVVLMSMKLGNINCLEMCEEIQEQLAGKNTKLILQTPHETVVELLACLSVKASGYCSKFLDVTLLPKVVKVVHQGGIWFDPYTSNTILEVFGKPLSTSQRDSDKTYATLSPEECQKLKAMTEYFIVDKCSIAEAKAILDRLVTDERVKQAARAIKEICGARHRQVVSEHMADIG